MQSVITFITFILLTGCSLLDKGENNPLPFPGEPAPLETKIGIAAYGIQSPQFKCNEFFHSLSNLKAYNLSFLWGTFGTDNHCLGSHWADHRLRSIQVHLMNEVCVRNSNCGPYEPLTGLSVSRVNELAIAQEGWFKERIMSWARPASDYINNNLTLRPDVECNISPGLESNTSSNAMRVIISWLKPLFPGCTFTYNHVNNSYEGVVGADYNETHNPHSVPQAPCYFNNDGYSIVFPEWGSEYSRNIDAETIPAIHGQFQSCDVIYFWHHSYNGINPSRGFVDPRQRLFDETTPFKLLGDRLGQLQGN